MIRMKSDKTVQKQIANGIRDYLHTSQRSFTIKDLFHDSRFQKIEEDDRMYLIKYFIDQFESIGMLDKIGKSYFYNRE